MRFLSSKHFPGPSFLKIGVYFAVFAQAASVHVYTVNNVVDGTVRCIVEDNNEEEGVSWELSEFNKNARIWNDMLKLQICGRNGTCKSYKDSGFITLGPWTHTKTITQPFVNSPSETTVRWNEPEAAPSTENVDVEYCRQFSILSNEKITIDITANQEEHVRDYKIFIDSKSRSSYKTSIALTDVLSNALDESSKLRAEPLLKNGTQWTTLAIHHNKDKMSLQCGGIDLVNNTVQKSKGSWILKLEDTKALWKIQNSKVYVAPGSLTPLVGSFEHVSEGSACIAIIYASQDAMKLTFERNGQVLDNATLTLKNTNGWAATKISTISLPNDTYTFKFEDVDGTDRFRAVASVRMCQKEEYYVVDAKSVTPKRCYTLATNTGAYIKSSASAENTKNLKEAFKRAAKLGEKLFCHDGSCKSKVICDSSGEECFCLSNFKGPNCSEICETATYGLYCKETCGHCKQHFCNKVTGECDSCKDGFKPPYCKENVSQTLGLIGGSLGLLAVIIIAGAIFYKTRHLLFGANDKEAFNLDQNQLEARAVMQGLVSKDDFAEHVRNSLIDGKLASEYESLPRGQQNQWDIGMSTPNLKKNRYRQIVAYDFNRVVLTGDVEESGYINASYVVDFLNRKAYIAAQGPKTDTLGDFWKMIWQEGVSTIIMMCELMEGEKVRCQMYWPDLNMKEMYGNITVFNKAERQHNNFTERTLRVTCPQGVRQVVQLHYQNWPRQGVPSELDSLKDMMEIIQAKTNIPILVHCSGGTGRTGTIILADQCLRRLAHFGTVNVIDTLKKLRGERVNMVETLDQYILVHHLIIAYLQL